jgi:hypothetical protein
MSVDDLKNPNYLVTLVTKPTEFEAHALVAVLREAGIEAFVFGGLHALLPLSEMVTPVPVQVRRADLEAARAAMEQNVADSVDLDWNLVDVGQRIDNVPLTTRSGMPLLARIGFGMALIVLAIALVAAATVLGTLWFG